MVGYKIRFILYSGVSIWRELSIPENVSFEQLHNLIQKVFGFEDYHEYEFQVPETIASEEAVDLNSVIQTVSREDAGNVKINEILDENPVLLYVYDFGDEWEIVVHTLDKIDYDNKTALLTDYEGKYNPREDIGGIVIFEEIMEAVGDDEELEYVLDEYGLTLNDLKMMDFENKFKKDLRIRLN